MMRCGFWVFGGITCVLRVRGRLTDGFRGV